MRHGSTLVARFRLDLVARGLLLSVGLAPLVTLAAEAAFGSSWFSELLERWFAFQCHREAGRSWVLFGRTLPVCTRCLGIYLGVGLGALVLRPRLAPVWLRIWVGAASVVMILDVTTEALGMRPPADGVRFITGALLAYPVGAAVVNGLRAGAAGGDSEAVHEP